MPEGERLVLPVALLAPARDQEAAHYGHLARDGRERAIRLLDLFIARLKARVVYARRS